jgi:hypothetical protein
MPAIDFTCEQPLSLAEAALLLPPGRKGARPTIGCILRWILDGVRGPTGERVRLEAVRLGGRWITSREAVNRLAERLTPPLDGEATRTRPPAKRQKASELAGRDLDEAWATRGMR